MDVTLVSAYDPNPPADDHRDRYVGGVERMLLEVATRLVTRGHEVTIVCSSGRDHPTTVENHVRMKRIRRRATILSAPIARLAQHVPKNSDIVHVAATYPFTTAPVLRRAHAHRIPAVLDFHFEPGPGSIIGRMASRMYGLIVPRYYDLARLVIVRSTGYGRSARSLDHVPESRWRVVPNGIDPGRFHPNGPPSQDAYLLFVGRLVPYKGLHVLLDALALARLDLPLYVVGGGPLRASLEARARRLGLDVRFLGRVADDALPALYRGARLTVLPSVTGQEAFGITLIESMACGTPVVASRLPGVEEVARFGGLVAEPRDPRALAAALRTALDAPLERGDALARRTHASFSWDAVTDQILDVYHEARSLDPGAAPDPTPTTAG